MDAETVHRAHRVGTGEADAQVGVEEDDAVADAGRVLELVVVLAEREAAFGDHRGEALEGRQVVLLELAQVATERGPRLAVTTATTEPAWRTGMHWTWARSLDPSRGESPSAISPVRKARGHERPGDLVDDRADEVHRVHGLTGGRPHLGQHHRAAAVLPHDRREQQEVGEAQVGQRLPRRREALDVTQRFPPERGLGARLLEEGGHGGIVPAAGLAKSASPMRANARASSMSVEKAGTLTMTSGPGGARRVSSCRNSASRRATTS